MAKSKEVAKAGEDSGGAVLVPPLTLTPEQIAEVAAGTVASAAIGSIGLIRGYAPAMRSNSYVESSGYVEM